jgi:hypothetical protein
MKAILTRLKGGWRHCAGLALSTNNHPSRQLKWIGNESHWDTIEPERAGVPMAATSESSAQIQSFHGELDLPYGPHLSISRLALQSLFGKAG